MRGNNRQMLLITHTTDNMTLRRASPYFLPNVTILSLYQSNALKKYWYFIFSSSHILSSSFLMLHISKNKSRFDTNAMEKKEAIQVHVDKQPKQENDGQLDRLCRSCHGRVWAFWKVIRAFMRPTLLTSQALGLVDCMSVHLDDLLSLHFICVKPISTEMRECPQ